MSWWRMQMHPTLFAVNTAVCDPPPVTVMFTGVDVVLPTRVTVNWFVPGPAATVSFVVSADEAVNVPENPDCDAKNVVLLGAQFRLALAGVSTTGPSGGVELLPPHAANTQQTATANIVLRI